MEWPLLLESRGPIGPAFFLFLGKSKQEEAFMGTCCILPTWMVLLALNILSSQQPSQSMCAEWGDL